MITLKARSKYTPGVEHRIEVIERPDWVYWTCKSKSCGLFGRSRRKRNQHPSIAVRACHQVRVKMEADAASS